VARDRILQKRHVSGFARQILQSARYLRALKRDIAATAAHISASAPDIRP
jgi:hypothetical protein